MEPEEKITGLDGGGSHGADEEVVVDIDTTDAVRMHTADPGEYEVQVLSAGSRGGTDKNGDAWLGFNLHLDIPSEETTKSFWHMEWMPTSDMKGKRLKGAISDLDIFKEAFGFDPSESIKPSDLVGRTAFAQVGLENDPKRGPQNNIKAWVTGPAEGGGDNIPGL